VEVRLEYWKKSRSLLPMVSGSQQSATLTSEKHYKLLLEGWGSTVRLSDSNVLCHWASWTGCDRNQKWQNSALNNSLAIFLAQLSPSMLEISLNCFCKLSHLIFSVIWWLLLMDRDFWILEYCSYSMLKLEKCYCNEWLHTKWQKALLVCQR